jgi:hypothetical protein
MVHMVLHEALEDVLIPKSELQLLQSFDNRDSITLSAFLPMDTPERREQAHAYFLQQIQLRLEELGPDAEYRDALKDDVEIVGLYLRTNGHRRHQGLAIFSCAAELFWRAYPLPVPPPLEVTVGPNFDIEPLKRLSEFHALPLESPVEEEIEIEIEPARA